MRQLLLRLRKAIGCPIDWQQIVHEPQFAQDLRIYWTEVAESHQADCEMSVYDSITFLTRGLGIDIRAIEQNAAIWRHRAVNDYDQRVGFFRDVVFKPPEEWQKHHSFRKLSRTQVIAMSAKVSYFFADVDVAMLENLMWCAFAQRWRDIVEKRPRHLFLLSEAELGASEGVSTRIVRFDIDYSNAEVHGHPRRCYDAACGIPLLYDENFELGAYDEDTYLKYDQTIDDEIVGDNEG